MSGLCTSGQASATIGKPTIPDADAQGKRPSWVDTNDQATILQTRADAAQRRKNLGLPDPAPDFNDELLQQARKTQAAQLLLKSNRRDALANNPGAPSPVSYSLLR
jgi:hypothetical protein